MTAAATPRRLLADIGATNARFARENGDGRIDKVRVFACDDYASIEDALAAYLAEGPAEAPPQEAAFAWAGVIPRKPATPVSRPSARL